MPTDHAAKVPYCGFESAEEAILEPSEDALARQRLELENNQLRGQVRNLEAALKAAGRVLEPYLCRLNGR